MCCVRDIVSCAHGGVCLKPGSQSLTKPDLQSSTVIWPQFLFYFLSLFCILINLKLLQWLYLFNYFNQLLQAVFRLPLNLLQRQFSYSPVPPLHLNTAGTMGCFTMDFLLNSLLYFLLSIDSPFQPDKGDIQMFQQQLPFLSPSTSPCTLEPYT